MLTDKDIEDTCSRLVDRGIQLIYRSLASVLDLFKHCLCQERDNSLVQFVEFTDEEKIILGLD